MRSPYSVDAAMALKKLRAVCPSLASVIAAEMDHLRTEAGDYRHALKAARAELAALKTSGTPAGSNKGRTARIGTP